MAAIMASVSGERVATGGGGGASLLSVIGPWTAMGHATRQEMETTPRRVKRAGREAARVRNDPQHETESSNDQVQWCSMSSKTERKESSLSSYRDKEAEKGKDATHRGASPA
ncbi:hypothetical protein B0H14DRAFT_2585139 [Mycena olivaceomarginata]|nr:hypothetical protein B0H14DRAFT_2585139 [Mycena olivaceomarginata]